MPKFIGPYKVLKVMNDSLNITIELLQEFRDRRINPTFHTNTVGNKTVQMFGSFGLCIEYIF